MYTRMELRQRIEFTLHLQACEQGPFHCFLGKKNTKATKKLTLMERCGEWMPFGSSRFARRLTIYSMEWDVRFSSCTFVAVAPLGGPIATAENIIGSSTTIRLWGAQGRLLSEFTLPPDVGAVQLLGWSFEESLLILTRKGTAIICEIEGNTITFQQNLTPSPPSEKLAVVRACGIFFIDENQSMHGLVLIEKKPPKVVETILVPQLSAAPQCIEVLAPESNAEEKEMVLIGPGEADPEFGCVFCVSEDKVDKVPINLPSGVAMMKLTPNYRFLALYGFDGIIRVVASDFSALKYSVRIGTKCPPLQMSWCGDHFLYLTFSLNQFNSYDPSEHIGLLVATFPKADPKLEQLRWDMDGCGVTAVCEEVDGVRIVTETAHYFVEDVPDCLANLFRMKSTALTAVAFDAYQTYMSGNVAGLIAVRDMAHRKESPYFSDIIDEIIDSAAHEIGVDNQMRLLELAAFCKKYCEKYDSEIYVDMVNRLRILNNVRDKKCGIPITFRQYQMFTRAESLKTFQMGEADVLVGRLANRKQYQAAYDVAVLSHMRQDRVEKILVRWSTAKVLANLPDDVINSEISKVFSRCPGVSFSHAALTAYNNKKGALAVQLLNDEPRPHNQVVLLMQMQQEELALEKALQSDNEDLLCQGSPASDAKGGLRPANALQHAVPIRPCLQHALPLLEAHQSLGAHRHTIFYRCSQRAPAGILQARLLCGE